MARWCDNSAERYMRDSSHPDTVIESGIAFFQGSDLRLRDNSKSHLCGSTAAQRHPGRSKYHWKPEKQPGKGAKPAQIHENPGFHEI